MSIKSRTPSIILDKLKKNILDKQSATQHLIALIENSTNVKHRLESLQVLREISIKFGSLEDNSDTMMNFFENLLLSDTDELIRNEAALILCHEYKQEALEPIRWALHHEESPLCLETIYYSLIKIINNLLKDNEPTAKLILIHEIKAIIDKDFRIDLENLKPTSIGRDFTIDELADILRNYFSLVFLKKSYWRLKYTVNKCKIIELDFIFKGLTKLPDAIKHLTNLKKLALRYNQITEIPEWICSLTSLESLNLNVNNINKLPISLGSLLHLKELLLWKNELQNLPDSICSLEALEHLNLRLNQIRMLPYNIGKLENLTELNLHDNKLVDIPDSISSLKSLEILNLSWNLLIYLPPSITLLRSLKSLDLERNELVQVPSLIDSLSSLEILNLGDNNLEHIPETIGNLKKLKILNLARNKLKSLPRSIYNLESLEELYLGDNDLDINPENIKKLETLGINVFL